MSEETTQIVNSESVQASEPVSSVPTSSASSLDSSPASMAEPIKAVFIPLSADGAPLPASDTALPSPAQQPPIAAPAAPTPPAPVAKPASSVPNRSICVKLGDLQMEFIWCPPGQFIMGCSEDEEGDSEDAPLHPVTLTHGFWMGKFPVTQAAYDLLAASAKVPLSPSKFIGENHPVERVNWSNAAQWCQALTAMEATNGIIPDGYEFRLPTEAEWEYACRAGVTTALNNGKILTCGDGICENLNEVAWYDKNSDGTTHDVGQKLPNRWGIYDMHGNVEEWCCDWYDEYPPEAAVDPVGPEIGRYHVCRGGNMGGMAMACSASARKGGNPTNRRCYRGFRVALAPKLAISMEALSQATRIQRAPAEKVVSDEELLQARLDLENSLNVNRSYESAISGAPDIQGSRNFRIMEPAIPMIWCPAGAFLMGSPDGEPGRNDDEKQHKVTLTKGFWMGMYPVTQEDYAVIAEILGARTRPSNFAGLKRPVESLEYSAIINWCKELTYLEFISGRIPDGYEYRLPTEAEWEYACRAGTTSLFNHSCEAEAGEDPRQLFEELAWYKYNSGYKTHAVGERKPNNWGFSDMHGNVREWCLDWYAPFDDAPCQDPTGPRDGISRVTRGGCYGDYPRHCRSAYRGNSEVTSIKANLGFRLVLGPRID